MNTAPARNESLPRPHVHRPRGGPVRASRTGRWRAFVLVAIHVLLLAHIAHWEVTGRSLSPLEPSESMQTLELGWVNAGFVLFLVSILATLVLGRFFCGWACHVVALQDFCSWLLRKVGLEPRPIRSRVLVWIPAATALYMFVWPQVWRLWLHLTEGFDYPQLQNHFATTDFWKTFPNVTITVLTFVVDGFLIVWLLGSKGFCTYGCPYGAAFSAVDRFAPGRIRVTDACEGCGHCTAVCSSNVRVHEEVARWKMVVDSGCMKCLDCVSVCPKDALYFGFGKGRPKGAKPRRTFDFSGAEELALTGLFFAAFFTYRGLYGQVSLLLAIGVAVITAICAIGLVRLLRAREFHFQRYVLRADGRWTRAGYVGVALMLGLLGFGLHSAVYRVPAWRGERAFSRADELARAGRTSEAQRAADASYEYLAFADSVGFFDQPDHLQRMAEIDRRRGQQSLKAGDAGAARGSFERARGYLDRVLDMAPELHHERVRLSDVKLLLGDVPGAVEELRTVLEEDPHNADAAKRWEAARARGIVTE